MKITSTSPRKAIVAGYVCSAVKNAILSTFFDTKNHIYNDPCIEMRGI